MSQVRPTEARRSNHLVGQTSPYLLQHLHNPVDWYPWGPEALAKARREDKPIFLSIGYAACHWCHVMEHESFEDERIAAILNAGFVPIKVDREERPDLDEVYMAAVQMMTGSGGWPLSVFLTPDLRPFYGGTYFPPDDRDGRPGLATVLESIRRAWTGRRDDVERSSRELAEQVRLATTGGASADAVEALGRREVVRAAAQLASSFDSEWGGFGAAPKFPPHGALALLLREHARSGEAFPLRMVGTTLDRMAAGGVYDQVGGGFARYSTDRRWLVPHFEKMLYDQALLVPVYVDAWLLARKPLYRRVAEETLEFVRREMTSPPGGFWSSLDADSEGHEGRFYVWTPEEVATALGPGDGAFFCGIYGITRDGELEGRSIPNLLGGSLADRARQEGVPQERLDSRLATLRSRLLAARASRPRPATDDKVLTSWNGLMITAFARAYQAFGNPDDLRSARRAADFVLAKMVSNGRLAVSWREGTSSLDGYLDDYAFLARGLVDLYEAGFDRSDLDAAVRLARSLSARFEDRESGGFFFTSHDHEAILARTRSLHDGALPSGAGVAAETLLRLALHLDEQDFRRTAMRTLRAYREAAARSPTAFTSLLAAADLAEGPVEEIAIAGPREDAATRALLAAARGRYLPNRIIALVPPGENVDGLPLLAGKSMIGGKPAAYVCRDYACKAPVTDPSRLADLL